MKYSITASLIAAALFISFLILFLLPPDYDKLNFVQKYFADRVYQKWDKYINTLRQDERAIVDYDALMNRLNYFERKFAGKILSINPQEIGFNGPFYSREKAAHLVKLDSKKLGSGNYWRETGVQYCPAHSYEDYKRLAAKMKADIGKVVYIDSGYRSPGRQAYLFFYYLVTSSDYVLKENARWIAMPGYSEHGHPVNHAIDFTSEEGINGFNDGQTPDQFEALPEYKWMLENANDFNFYLSYPKDNPYGVAFEPWHWHWQKDGD